MTEREPVPRVVFIGIVALVSFALMLGIGLSTHILIGLGVALLTFGAFILQGLVQIPADPPHRGILTFGGKRYPEVLDEGWRFLPFYNVPYIGYGLVLVKIEKINFDLREQEVRTPDLAAVEIPVSVTFRPDDHPEGKELIEYENSGGQDGVIGILTDIIRQELREWAVNLSPPEGKVQANWEDVVKAKDEAVDILIMAVAGTEEDLSDDEKKAIRRGNGKTKHSGLGIIINRLNVGEIKLHGELAAAAEREAKEWRERAGEEVELNFVGEQIEKLTATGLTPVEARRTIQVAQGKISETVKTNVIGVTPESLEALGNAMARARGGGQRQRQPRQEGQEDGEQ